MRNRLFVAVALVWLALGMSVRGQSREDAVRPPTRSKNYKRMEFTSKEGVKLAYWLMTPAKVEEGKKYPLVLALHGRGGNTQAATVLGTERMRKEYPCFVMAPAAPRSAVWATPRGMRGLRGEPRMPAVLEALGGLEKKHSIDPDRVYVTGQSMGGFGSFGAIAASPGTFAAAVPICGGWNAADAEKMKDVPIWVFHGAADRTVPVKRSRDMVEALKAAGGKPKYTEYAGVGHNSWTRTYESAETWKWLFSQRRQWGGTLAQVTSLRPGPGSSCRGGRMGFWRLVVEIRR